ncbi:unnamed protein product [Closterium sp. NIES-54]
MVCHRLVSGLPESLALLPRSPAPPCTPCVEGRQRAAPHSSFLPTTAPLHTLHLDVWGPSLVVCPRQEHFFLIVVGDYSGCTTVFLLRRKANVLTVLEPWLLARGGAQGLRELWLHLDRGGEFASTRLETFCQGWGIIQSYTLLDSPHQNGVAERCIGLVMAAAQTSMCHAGAPQFFWPQAVRYAVHQLNLWPSDARPRVTPIFLWTGFLGVAADYRVWGCLAHVRAPRVNKLSARTRACVFFGFPLDASSLVFYNLVTHQPLRTSLSTIAPVAPPSSCLALLGVSQRPVLVLSGGAGGAVAEGEGTRAARAHRASSGGAGSVRVETTPEEDTAVLTQRPRPASPPGFPSVPRFPPRSPPRPVAAEPGVVPTGGSGVPRGVVCRGSDSGGAGAGDTSTLTPTPRTVRFLT